MRILLVKMGRLWMIIRVVYVLAMFMTLENVELDVQVAFSVSIVSNSIYKLMNTMKIDKCNVQAVDKDNISKSLHPDR